MSLSYNIRSTTVYYDSDLENNTHGDDNSNLEHSPMNMVQLMNEGIDKLRNVDNTMKAAHKEPLVLPHPKTLRSKKPTPNKEPGNKRDSSYMANYTQSLRKKMRICNITPSKRYVSSEAVNYMNSQPEPACSNGNQLHNVSSPSIDDPTSGTVTMDWNHQDEADMSNNTHQHLAHQPFQHRPHPKSVDNNCTEQYSSHTSAMGDAVSCHFLQQSLSDCCANTSIAAHFAVCEDHEGNTLIRDITEPANSNYRPHYQSVSVHDDDLGVKPLNDDDSPPLYDHILDELMEPEPPEMSIHSFPSPIHIADDRMTQDSSLTPVDPVFVVDPLKPPTKRRPCEDIKHDEPQCRRSLAYNDTPLDKQYCNIRDCIEY